jgi:hypothetical protein
LNDKLGDFVDQGRNFNSLLFENEIDRESYVDQMKHAIKANRIREENFAMSDVKHDVVSWMENLKLKFEKKCSHKKTIVFDLDETLVRAVGGEEPVTGYDYRIRVVEEQNPEEFFVSYDHINNPYRSMLS